MTTEQISEKVEIILQSLSGLQLSDCNKILNKAKIGLEFMAYLKPSNSYTKEVNEYIHQANHLLDKELQSGIVYSS